MEASVEDRETGRSSTELQVLEKDKPCALISGDEGVHLEQLDDLVKQHFQVICYSDLLQYPQLHSKIQAVFLWQHLPAVEASLLRSLPALKVIASGGVGVDHLDLPLIASFGVKVSNTPGVVSDATADMAMALLLASARKIVQGYQVAVDPKTITNHIPQSLVGLEVTGSTLGIIGMGDVGYKIAQRSKGFEMQILYHNRTRRSDEDERAVGARYCKNMDDLLRRSDFVMVAVTLTPDTTGLIGHRELSLMKPTATLVNVSRGQVVDQDSLVQALQCGTIHAAALDVTHPEPLPRDHPLLNLPNVLITPHIGFNTCNTSRRIMQKMIENAVAAVKGVPIPDEVKMK
ncbi:putative 2-ketogluconate reductase [Diretmus argenteus]